MKIILIWSLIFGVLNSSSINTKNNEINYDYEVQEINTQEFWNYELPTTDNPTESSTTTSTPSSTSEPETTTTTTTVASFTPDSEIINQGIQDESINHNKGDIWRVMDLSHMVPPKNDSGTNATDDDPMKITESAPACLIAQVKMKFNFPLALSTDNKGVNVTVPQSSSQINGECGSLNQTLNVTWSPEIHMDYGTHRITNHQSQVTLYFLKNSVNVTLVGISAKIILPSSSAIGNFDDYDESEGESRKLLEFILHTTNPVNESIIEAPHRYCYTCGVTFVVPLTVEGIKVHSLFDDGDEEYDDYKYDGTISQLPSINDKVYLYFESIKVEPFRFNPHSDGFTHLKWDCQTYWMLPYIPILVSAALITLVFFMVLAFCFREAMGFKVERPQHKSPYKPI